MESRELERIRFTTQHFNDLQGLRYGVPLGLIALGGGLVLLGWGGPQLLRVLGSAGALALIFGGRRYYEHTFGAVQQPPVQPDTGVYPVSIYSPAGPIPRLALHEQVTPIARTFLVMAILVATVFVYFQVLPPNFVVQGNEALGQHPRILAETEILYAPPFISPWAYPTGGPIRSPSMLRAVSAQTLYLLFGCFFLSLWIWRGRHPSQNHLVPLAFLPLSLAALGTSLGYLARRDGVIPPFLDRLLPALVYPGIALLLCGAVTILAGLFDHWHLTQALRPAASRMED